MKVRVGCTIKDYFVGEGDTIIASWSIGFEGSGCTVGKAYTIKGISTTKNLIVKNDNGEIKEYAPVHFLPC